MLQAHRKLMDLERSRDDLMYEQYRMDSGNKQEMDLIRRYFGQVQPLSDELAKQLWMVLQRAMVTVRRDPTMLVSVVRIIEREKIIDNRMLDRQKQTNFIPPGRPKRWKERMFQVRTGGVDWLLLLCLINVGLCVEEKTYYINLHIILSLYFN